jgi:putative sigma-54 modulation protein
LRTTAQEETVQLTVTGRHLQITDEMRGYAEAKAGRLPHYYDRLESVEVVLDHVCATFTVEIVARSDHKHVFVAHAQGGDFHEAYDLASDKVARQLSRHKERVRNRKHVSSGEPLEGCV